MTPPTDISTSSPETPTPGEDEIICAACTATVAPMIVCDTCGEQTALNGRYRLVEVVGRGSFGMTYRATDLEADRTVAIKEMLVRSADTLKAVELFEREADVLESLDHDRIPGYYDDFWREDGRSTAFFLVQEFVDGQLVDDAYGSGPVRPDEVFDLLGQLLETLTYLHEFSPPVVHRDVKPENLMIRRDDGQLVLIDFGSVQAAIQPEEGGSTVAGTFGYMAPEQFSGRAQPRSDVYGAAATVVSLLLGEELDATPGQTPQLDDLNVAPGYRALLEQMMAVDPTDRPSAAEAARRLRQLRQDPDAPTVDPGATTTAPQAEPNAAVPALPQNDQLPRRPDQFETLPIDPEDLGDPPRNVPAQLVDNSSPALEYIGASLLPLTLAGYVIFTLGLAAQASLILIALALFFPGMVHKNHTRDTEDREQIWRHGRLTRGWAAGKNYAFRLGNTRYGGTADNHLGGRPECAPLEEGEPIPVLFLPDSPGDNMPVTDDLMEAADRLPEDA